MTTSIESVSPSRVGRYHHLDCARYLRYSSTASAGRARVGVTAIQECDPVVVSYGVAVVVYAMGEQVFIYSLNRFNVSIPRSRAKTVVFRSKALTEPPVQALADDCTAASTAFMQGLVRHAATRGEERQVAPGGSTTLRLRKVPSSDDGPARWSPGE